MPFRCVFGYAYFMNSIRKRFYFCLLIIMHIIYQISSRILATAIHEQLEGHVPDRVIKLLKSFCYPDDVKKHPEASNPLDTNASLFDTTESLQIRPKQKQGLKEDPIYNMFFSKEQKRGMLKWQLYVILYSLYCRFK